VAAGLTIGEATIKNMKSREMMIRTGRRARPEAPGAALLGQES
jgi:hypothetical protein